MDRALFGHQIINTGGQTSKYSEVKQVVKQELPHTSLSPTG